MTFFTQNKELIEREAELMQRFIKNAHTAILFKTTLSPEAFETEGEVRWVKAALAPIAAYEEKEVSIAPPPIRIPALHTQEEYARIRRLMNAIISRERVNAEVLAAAEHELEKLAKFETEKVRLLRAA